MNKQLEQWTLSSSVRQTSFDPALRPASNRRWASCQDPTSMHKFQLSSHSAWADKTRQTECYRECCRSSAKAVVPNKQLLHICGASEAGGMEIQIYLSKAFISLVPLDAARFYLHFLQQSTDNWGFSASTFPHNNCEKSWKAGEKEISN